MQHAGSITIEMLDREIARVKTELAARGIDPEEVLDASQEPAASSEAERAVNYHHQA